METHLQTAPLVPRLAGPYSISRFDCADLTPMYLLTLPNGRRWKISHSLAQIIGQIDGVSDIEAVAGKASLDQDCAMTSSEVRDVITGLLVKMGVVDTSASGVNAEKAVVARKKRRSVLLFRIPLLPSALTRVLARIFEPAFQRAGVISAGGLAFCLHLWWMGNYFTSAPLSPEVSEAGWLTALTLLLTSFFAHELGHVSAAYRYTRSAGGIGFGVYIVFPVLYADVTDTWTLPRMQRALVDLAGIYFQLVFAAVIILAGILVHNPAFNDTVVAIAVIAIDFSCLANLNPFLRLDGYWFLSDVSGIANLSRRLPELLFARRRLASWLSPGALSLLWVYGILTIAFWGFFLGSGYFYLQGLAAGRYADLIQEFRASLSYTVLRHSSAPFVSALLNLFFPTVVLISLASIVIAMVRRLAPLLWRRGRFNRMTGEER